MAKNSKKVETEEKEVRIRPNLENYKPGRSASGKRTQNCGDAVAEACDAMTIDELIQVAESGGCEDDLSGAYGHLNGGQQVMCIRNVIRGLFNAQDAAHVEDKTVPTGIVALDNWAAKAGKSRDKRVTQITKEAEAKTKARADKATATAAKKKTAKKKAA